MNVFDVLREKLKESQERYDDVSFVEMNENGHTLDFEYANGKKDGVSESIEIVNQVEKEFAPKTNADRIRSMTDEELAEFIANDCLEIADEICGSCTQETTKNCGSGCCVEHIVNWLGKEVD